MRDVSAQDLRGNTMAVLRRVQAGERLRVTIGRRPVAQLDPIEHGSWTSGPALELALSRAPSDAGLLDDLAPLREQIVE